MQMFEREITGNKMLWFYLFFIYFIYFFFVLQSEKSTLFGFFILL
jgi:hypothetical protein